MPSRFLKNQCQIIIFLILKSDNIENSRIELKRIVLPVPSNQIKVTFIIILPFNSGLLGDWGGAKGMLAPLSNYLGGGGAGSPRPPLPTPMPSETPSNLPIHPTIISQQFSPLTEAYLIHIHSNLSLQRHTWHALADWN